MQTAIKDSPKKAPLNLNSATITVTFADGVVKSFDVAGQLFLDHGTGAFKILSETGSKFVYIPDENRFTGKAKRRLKVLYNL